MTAPGAAHSFWRRFRLHRRQNKIIALAFIPAALILGTVALVNFFAYRQVTADIAMERDGQLVKMAAVQFAADLEARAAPLEQAARALALAEGHAGARQAALERAAETLSPFDGGVTYLDAHGMVVAAYPPRPALLGQDWSGQPFFQDAARSRQTVFSDLAPVDTGPQGEPLFTAAVAVPVTVADAGFGGVLAGFYRLNAAEGSPFAGTLRDLPLSAGRQIVLADGHGLLLYHPDAALLGADYGSSPAVAALLRGEEGALRTENEAGESIVAAYAPVLGTSWGLVTAQRWAMLVAPYAGYQNAMLLLLLLGLLVPAAVVVFGVSRLMRPLQALITATQEVARGEFGSAVTVDSGDEMETLAHQFNLMSAELAASYRRLEERLGARTRELGALNAIAAVVSHTPALEEMLHAGLDETLPVMGLDAGGVYLLDSEGDTLRLVAHRNLDDSLARALASASGMSCAAQVVAQGQPLRLHDLLEDSRPEAGELVAAGFRSLACFPLRASGQLLGAFLVLARQPRTFAPEDVDLLTSIGQQMGVAVENARLLAQVQQDATREERQRLARELHDAVTQTLFSATLIAEVLPQLWEKDEALGRQRLADLHRLNRGALAEMRTLLLELRPAALVESSLPELLRQLAAAVQGRCELQVELSVDGAPPAGRLPGDLQVALYRIAQEALNNVVRHAGASRVAIHVAFGAAGVLLEVADDGCGFDAGAGRPDSFGLAIMRERAAHAGATLQIESAPGAGTCVSVFAPLNKT